MARQVIVTELSGGMKRKVNLGIALIGGSKVSLLQPLVEQFRNNSCGGQQGEPAPAPSGAIQN